MTNVSLGLGPATVSVPVSSLKRLQRFFRRRDLSEQVQVLPHLCEIRVLADNEGEIALYLWILNFSGRKVVPDRFAVTSWSYLARGMPDLPWTVRTLHTAIKAHSVGSLYASSQLNPAGIKRIADATPRETYQLAGRLPVGITGEFHVEGARQGSQFQFEVQRPTLSAYFLALGAPQAGH